MILQQLLAETTNQPSFAAGLGSILTGVSELLLALGAGIGFIVRYRHNARKERTRVRHERAAVDRENAKRLDRQYADRIAQYEATIAQQQQAYDSQQRMYEEKLANLQSVNTRLVNQIIKSQNHS